jgi:hypothetical protein
MPIPRRWVNSPVERGKLPLSARPWGRWHRADDLAAALLLLNPPHVLERRSDSPPDEPMHLLDLAQQSVVSLHTFPLQVRGPTTDLYI